jgi:ADP-heptose:LPS heptosyltransferase
VAITGAGKHDEAGAREVMRSAPDVVDLCGATDLALLRFVLREAAGCVTIDSAASHLAAAEGTPGVAIMSTMTKVAQWRPLSPRIAVQMESASASQVRDVLDRQMRES